MYENPSNTLDIDFFSEFVRIQKKNQRNRLRSYPIVKHCQAFLPQAEPTVQPRLNTGADASIILAVMAEVRNFFDTLHVVAHSERQSRGTQALRLAVSVCLSVCLSL